MWFKNLKLYQLTSKLELTEEQLQTQLESMSFSPCGSQDIATMGWTSPFRNSDMLFQKTQSCKQKNPRLIAQTGIYSY